MTATPGSAIHANTVTPIRSVAVFGGGIVALTAALAFHAALPDAATTLVATPLAPAAFADHLPVMLPSGAALFDRLGLDPAALVARGAARYRLAERFADWPARGEAWLLPEGEALRLAGPGALHQRWLRAHRAGTPPRFHDLYPAAAVAGRPPGDGDFGGVEPAIAFDAATLAGALAHRLARTPVTMLRSGIAQVEHNAEGGIAGVALTGGGRIAADLIVDATGPDALLGGGTDFFDWTRWLPADRVLVAADPRAAPALLDDYRALDLGWSATWARPGTGVTALAFASAITEERRARRALARARDTAALIAVAPGRRAAGWVGNRLALGEAAVQLGPLGLRGLALAHAQLALALALLPGRAMEPLLLAEYNRRAGNAADQLRDSLAALCLLPRRDGSFWQDLPARERPATLDQTVRGFAHRGTLPLPDEPCVSGDAWAALLIGLGLRPQHADPLALSTDTAQTLAALEAGRRALAARAAGPAVAGLRQAKR